MMGRHPLSRASDGQQLKNCKPEDLENYQDRYRPPGIVKVVEKYMVPEKNDKDEMGNTIKSNKEVKGPIYGQPPAKKEGELRSMFYTKADEKQKSSLFDNQNDRD